MKHPVWRNGLITGFLIFILIEATPLQNPVIDKLRVTVDPIGDFTGLWQGTWDLFGPDVDKENNWIEAKIYFSGQETEPTTWRSPDWKQQNCLQTFALSREIEFFDRLPNKRNSEAWPSTANYIATQVGKDHPEAKVGKVELISVHVPIPSPRKITDRTLLGQGLYPVESPPDRFVFYTREFHD